MVIPAVHEHGNQRCRYTEHKARELQRVYPDVCRLWSETGVGIERRSGDRFEGGTTGKHELDSNAF